MQKIIAKLATGFVCVAAAATPLLAQHEHEAATKQAAASDVILAAMQQELDREKAQLVLPGMQRPYFIEYRLEDIDSYSAVANYGALTGENERRQRVVRVEVRVGDYISDSSTSRGEGSLELAPGDDDPAALKFALWTATDEAYKAALRAYANKQASLKNFQTPPTANDFTAARPITHLEPVRVLALDRDGWKRSIIEASGLFATAPETRSFAESGAVLSSASINGLVANRYMVDTDGAVLRTGLLVLFGLDRRGWTGSGRHGLGPQQWIDRGHRRRP